MADCVVRLRRASAAWVRPAALRASTIWAEGSIYLQYTSWALPVDLHVSESHLALGLRRGPSLPVSPVASPRGANPRCGSVLSRRLVSAQVLQATACCHQSSKGLAGTVRLWRVAM